MVASVPLFHSNQLLIVNCTDKLGLYCEILLSLGKFIGSHLY